MYKVFVPASFLQSGVNNRISRQLKVCPEYCLIFCSCSVKLSKMSWGVGNG